MYTVNPIELLSVRESLRTDPVNLGVGLLHQITGRIVLRPFEEIRHGGGHLELAAEYGWLPDECLGFMVARPANECVMVNLSQLNAQNGPLFMQHATFRTILLSLRQCWAGMAIQGTPG